MNIVGGDTFLEISAEANSRFVCERRLDCMRLQLLRKWS